LTLVLVVREVVGEITEKPFTTEDTVVTKEV
jgi:hypothetical protein